MAHLKVGIDIGVELCKIDEKIAEARGKGNKKAVQELNATHRQLTKLRSQGHTKVPGDKRPGRKDTLGEDEPKKPNSFGTIKDDESKSDSDSSAE